jgi:[ribosomal protein S18]-alanine N-acetyltransferase
LNIIVREATAADIPAIVALERDSALVAHWPAASYQSIFQGGSPRLALVVDPEPKHTLLGFLVARITGDECELENIVVAPHVRGRGLASELLRALTDAARERKLSRILLEVRESNIAARMFYEKSGFELNGRRKSYYRDPTEDAVLYALKL